MEGCPFFIPYVLKRLDTLTMCKEHLQLDLRAGWAGFPQYGFKAGISDGPSCRPRAPHVVQFASALRAPRCLYHRILALSRGVRCAGAPPFKWLLPLYPRGPRSSPGYVVPARKKLT